MRLGLDLIKVERELDLAKADLRRLKYSAADAEEEHTAALSVKDDIHTTLLQNANAELQSEKSKAEKLESDLREVKQELERDTAALSAKDGVHTTLLQNVNAELQSEKSKAEKLESDLNEAKTKYTDAERKATEAEATHTAALWGIKAMKDQELAQQRVEQSITVNLEYFDIFSLVKY